jgi:hypothetical protein
MIKQLEEEKKDFTAKFTLAEIGLGVLKSTSG